MDIKTKALVEKWRATLTPREKALHELAAVELKKKLVTAEETKEDIDNGSYYPEKCHAFKAWVKKQSTS